MIVLAGGATKDYQSQIALILSAVAGDVLDFDAFSDGPPIEASDSSKNVIAMSTTQEPWAAFEAFMEASTEPDEAMAFYLPAKRGLAHYLAAGLTPDEAIFAWTETTRNLLSFIKAHRKKVVVIDIDAAVRFPNKFMEFCVNRYRFNGGGELDAIEDVAEPTALYGILSNQIIKQNHEVNRLQQELDARSEYISPYTPPDRFDLMEVHQNFQLSTREFETLEAQLEALTSKDKRGTRDFKNLKEKFELLSGHLKDTQDLLEEAVKDKDASEEENKALKESQALFVEQLKGSEALLNQAIEDASTRFEESQVLFSEQLQDSEALLNQAVKDKNEEARLKAAALEAKTKLEARQLLLAEQIQSSEILLNEAIKDKDAAINAQGDLERKLALLTADLKLAKKTASSLKVKLDSASNANSALGETEASLLIKQKSLEQDNKALKERVDVLDHKQRAAQLDIKRMSDAKAEAETKLARTGLKDDLMSEHVESIQADAEQTYYNYVQISSELEEFKKIAKWREVQAEKLAARLEDDLARTHKRINDLENSFSWRATRPVRIMSRVMGVAKKRSSKDDVQRILASGLFDVTWYTTTYPDLANITMDPVEHFVKYGAFEGRSPGPNFNTRKYTKEHPNLLIDQINPLLHFLDNRDGVKAANTQTRV